MRRGIPKSKNRQAHPGLVGSWTKNREVTRSYQSSFKTHARHYGVMQRIGHWMNGEAISVKTAKTYAVLFLIITAILAGTVLSQGSLFHSSHTPPCVVQLLGTPCTDPTTNVWQRLNAQPATISDFNMPSSQTHFYFTNCDGLGMGQDCIDLRAVNGQNSVAISKNPINDLSIALSKTMGVLGTYSFNAQGFSQGSVGSITNSWGFYITMNNTAPEHDIGAPSLPYSPLNDTSVLAAVQIFCVSGTCGGTNASGFYDTMVFVLRHTGVGDTLLSEFNGACGGSSSSCIAILNTSSYPSRCNPTPTCTGANIANIASLYLNYTGSSTTSNTCAINSNVLTGAGCSWICDSVASVATLAAPACIGTNIIPPNPFGSGHFFYGAWNNLQNFDVAWEFAPGTPPTLGGTNGMEVTAFVASPSCNTSSSPNGQVCPNIDTGGFFGPIIKALIDIGIWILAGILQFVSIVAGLIITAMNVVGNFLGIGPLGTDMVNLFATILSFVSNVFANFFTWFSSIFSTIGNAFLALAVLLTTYFTQITAFFAGLVGFLTFLWTVVSAVLQYGSYPVAFSITVWWVWGMFAAYDDGIEGFLGWVDMSEAVLFKGLNVLIWFGEETMKGIARLRTILPRPAGI